ncbi:50S ribosomal protein L1 [bacterium]|jgi:large subunit ribosomal protein L1|nr:50S ribosomal protein L1 [bacterium]MBT4122050.1 50S ribosomal protein L1 [bacterium]MBT4335514.1 50S ribosomal protein L1 [bacterium]MBT4495857.1 50S ribosomal protein L1 [bacterium]MBT4764348.1 50S ribosomal protein L1 [bacterium]
MKKTVKEEKVKKEKVAKVIVDREKIYTLEEGIKLVKETSTVKFDASVEVHIRLGIDPKKGDQAIRSTVKLPHGTGKTKKIAAFVSPKKEKEAKEAGAYLVGGVELIKEIKKSGKCDFEIAVCEPELMRDLSQIAKLLGPKGLMPNPKIGTVTKEIKKTIEELNKGLVDFRNDDSANLHLMVGKVSFEDKQLKENIEAFLEALKRIKPESLKGSLIQSISICSAMGPGIRVSYK